MSMPDSAFNLIPTDVRAPGAYIELDGSLAGTLQTRHRALLFGQMLAAGTADADVPVLIPGDGREAVGLFGRGSQLALAVAAFRQNNPTTELWAIGVDDLVAGVAAELDVTFGGTATEAGQVALYIAGVRVFVPVAVGDDGSDLAAAAETAVNANLDLPVTASADAAVLTVTCRHKGAIGNEIRIQTNVRGVLGQEKLPAGSTVSIPSQGYLASGSGNPDLTAAIASMADTPFRFVGYPWTDSTSMDALGAEFARRAGPLVQTYSLGFNCMQGSPSARQTFGVSRNNEFNTTIRSYDAPGPCWLKGARYMAQCAIALSNHPARPLLTLPLIGELPPPAGSRAVYTDNQTDLYSGISTDYVDAAGTVRIDRAVTNYQKNELGVADTAWLDLTTPATVFRLSDEMEFLVVQKFLNRRCILVDDDAIVDPGLPVASPRSIRAEILTHYRDMQRQGLVEDFEQFKANLIVARSEGDPTRVNILYTPDLANPLYVMAVQVRFSLN